MLRNRVAFERMRATAVTDPLTDLPNSRALGDFFRKLVADPAGEGGSNALIMIDLDDFKAVNDGHGHQAGDAALTAVATALRSHIRGSDFCARYGGDEFVAVLAGCDRHEAEQPARRLQHAVSRIQLPGEGGRVLSLGIRRRRQRLPGGRHDVRIADCVSRSPDNGDGQGAPPRGYERPGITQYSRGA